MLLEQGAGINTHSNEFKESALTLACYKGHLEMVNFLLQAGADQVSEWFRYSEGKTSLFLISTIYTTVLV